MKFLDWIIYLYVCLARPAVLELLEASMAVMYFELRKCSLQFFFDYNSYQFSSLQVLTWVLETENSQEGVRSGNYGGCEKTYIVSQRILWSHSELKQLSLLDLHCVHNSTYYSTQYENMVKMTVHVLTVVLKLTC